MTRKQKGRIIIGSLLLGPLGVGIGMTMNEIEEKRKEKAFTDEQLKEMGINVIEVSRVELESK